MIGLGLPTSKKDAEEQKRVLQERLVEEQLKRDDFLSLFESTGRGGYKTLADSYSSTIISIEYEISLLEKLIANYQIFSLTIQLLRTLTIKYWGQSNSKRIKTMPMDELIANVNHIMTLAYSPDENDMDAFINAYLSADDEVKDIVVGLIGAESEEKVVLH